MSGLTNCKEISLEHSKNISLSEKHFLLVLVKYFTGHFTMSGLLFI